MVSVVVYIKGIQFPWFPIGFGYLGKSNFYCSFRLWTSYKKSTTFSLLIHIKINKGIIVYKTEGNPPVMLSFGYGSPGESNCHRCTMEFQLLWFCCLIFMKILLLCPFFAVDLRRDPITIFILLWISRKYNVHALFWL
jgi:hypothetical protein